MSGFEYIHTPQELAQRDRDYAFLFLVEKLADVPMSEFTLKESLLIHKLHVADAYTFPPHIDEKELTLLQEAEQRIFGKKDRTGNPYDAGASGGSLQRRGQNRI